MNPIRTGILFTTIVSTVMLCGCKPKQLEEPEVTPTAAIDTTGNDHLLFNDSKKNVGIYLDDVDTFLQLTPRPEILGWFEDWNGKPSMNKLQACGTEQIAIPFITWQPTDIDFHEILSGSYDEYIAGYFEKLAMICPKTDILLRFAHEMELRPQYQESWYSWQGYDPQLYIDVWKHLVTISRKIDPNIKWVWSPNRADDYSMPYYPGDEYVDYVGLSVNLPSDKAPRFKDFYDFYRNERGKEVLESFGKPIIISEAAFCDGDGTAREDYFRSVFDWHRQDPSITAIVFFNYDVSDTQQYQFTDDQDCLKIFGEGIQSLQ